MSKVVKDKDGKRMADCLIPLVDPSAEQLETLKGEFSQIVDERGHPDKEELTNAGRQNLLQRLIDYLFSKSSKR